MGEENIVMDETCQYCSQKFVVKDEKEIKELSNFAFLTGMQVHPECFFKNVKKIVTCNSEGDVSEAKKTKSSQQKKSKKAATKLQIMNLVKAGIDDGFGLLNNSLTLVESSESATKKQNYSSVAYVYFLETIEYIKKVKPDFSNFKDLSSVVSKLWVEDCRNRFKGEKALIGGNLPVIAMTPFIREVLNEQKSKDNIRKAA